MRKYFSQRKRRINWTTIVRYFAFPSLNIKTNFTKLKMNSLHTLKTFSTKYNIACNTLILMKIMFSLLKKCLWDKSQGCRLPGKFFGAPKKEGEGNETKNHCSDALRSIIKLYGVTRFPSTEIMKSSSHVSYLWCRL